MGSCEMSDRQAVTAALGRVPAAEFKVVVRTTAGAPAVIRNAPFLEDGTPMPTLYWLVEPELCARVGRLEASGGVRLAEADVDPHALLFAHEQYAAERSASIRVPWNGPRPTGGVGGTRVGVKCLHAHLAWWLAGGEDPVGAWVAHRLAIERDCRRGVFCLGSSKAGGGQSTLTTSALFGKHPMSPQR